MLSASLILAAAGLAAGATIPCNATFLEETTPNENATAIFDAAAHLANTHGESINNLDSHYGHFRSGANAKDGCRNRYLQDLGFNTTDLTDKNDRVDFGKVNDQVARMFNLEPDNFLERSDFYDSKHSPLIAANAFENEDGQLSAFNFTSQASGANFTHFGHMQLLADSSGVSRSEQYGFLNMRPKEQSFNVTIIDPTAPCEQAQAISVKMWAADCPPKDVTFMLHTLDGTPLPPEALYNNTGNPYLSVLLKGLNDDTLANNDIAINVDQGSTNEAKITVDSTNPSELVPDALFGNHFELCVDSNAAAAACPWGLQHNEVNNYGDHADDGHCGKSRLKRALLPLAIAALVLTSILLLLTCCLLGKKCIDRRPLRATDPEKPSGTVAGGPSDPSTGYQRPGGNPDPATGPQRLGAPGSQGGRPGGAGGAGGAGGSGGERVVQPAPAGPGTGTERVQVVQPVPASGTAAAP